MLEKEEISELKKEKMRKLSPKDAERIIYALASFGASVLIVGACTLLWMLASILSRPI